MHSENAQKRSAQPSVCAPSAHFKPSQFQFKKRMVSGPPGRAAGVANSPCGPHARLGGRAATLAETGVATVAARIIPRESRGQGARGEPNARENGI